MARSRIRRTWWPPLLLLLLYALALPACGAHDDSAAPLGEATSAERTDPCDLLTSDEIATATGWSMPEATPATEERDGQAICHWEDPAVAAMVQVQVHEGAGRDLFEERRVELESIGAARDVDVLGADAAWDDAAHGLVGVLVGEHFAQVAAYGPPLSDTQHLELAELLAGRLR